METSGPQHNRCRPFHRQVKLNNPLMETETKYQPITNECMPHYVKLNNPPNGDGNITGGRKILSSCLQKC